MFRSLTSFFLLCLFCCLCSSCVQQRMRAAVRESQTVVLDIGHYFNEKGEGQGARCPDNRYGKIEETDFWYRYAHEVKKVVESAGYTCIITNRGATPSQADLAKAAKEAPVVQLNTPFPSKVYRSQQHPKRMAVGMVSVNYALDQKPACVVFLHHNSNASTWKKAQSSALFCNQEGRHLAQCMALVASEQVLNHGMENGGQACGVIVRQDGRLGGGDWLNACNDSCVPAAITEIAYLNNPDHARYLSQDKNAKRFAQCIGQGIVKHLQTR